MSAFRGGFFQKVQNASAPTIAFSLAGKEGPEMCVSTCYRWDIGGPQSCLRIWARQHSKHPGLGCHWHGPQKSPSPPWEGSPTLCLSPCIWEPTCQCLGPPVSPPVKQDNSPCLSPREPMRRNRALDVAYSESLRRKALGKHTGAQMSGLCMLHCVLCVVAESKDVTGVCSCKFISLLGRGFQAVACHAWGGVCARPLEFTST